MVLHHRRAQLRYQVANGHELAAVRRRQVAEARARMLLARRRVVRLERRALMRAATPAQNRRLGRYLARRRGWVGAQWRCLRSLGDHESGWDHRARNIGSGAWGIGQFLGATARAYARVGALSTTARGQIRALLQYVADRYRTPCVAWAAWLSRLPHWY